MRRHACKGLLDRPVDGDRRRAHEPGGGTLVIPLLMGWLNLSPFTARGTVYRERVFRIGGHRGLCLGRHGRLETVRWVALPSFQITPWQDLVFFTVVHNLALPKGAMCVLPGYRGSTSDRPFRSRLRLGHFASFSFRQARSWRVDRHWRGRHDWLRNLFRAGPDGRHQRFVISSEQREDTE